MGYKYFNDAEVEGLNPTLCRMLDQMRDIAEIPIFITCGLRTVEENKRVGGVPDSAHLKGLAADLRCHDSASRYKLIWAALKVGFKRIEVATGHLHVDIDNSKSQNVMFLGISR